MENAQPLETREFYSPSELIGIFKDTLIRQNNNAKITYLKGIYFQRSANPSWNFCYDKLRDENGSREITLRISHQLRANLQNGNLVVVGGILTRNISDNGAITLTFEVTRTEVLQEQTVDEDEIKRMEIRKNKSQKGFKNVDLLLEQLLFAEQRPKIALLLANSSITMEDFNRGGGDIAKSAIDFKEFRVSFANSAELCNTLRNIDSQHFDIISIVRGGGSGLEALDDLDVLEVISNLTTPLISAVGHAEDKVFIKEIADKVVAVPNALGQYFKDMIEEISEKKTRSKAAIMQQIEKKYADQIEKTNEQLRVANKQNDSLQEQLKNMSTAHVQEQSNYNRNLASMQETLKNATESNNTLLEINQRRIKKLEKTNATLRTAIIFVALAAIVLALISFGAK